MGGEGWGSIVFQFKLFGVSRVLVKSRGGL